MLDYYRATMTVPRDKEQRDSLRSKLEAIVDQGFVAEDFEFIFSVRKDYWSKIAELAFEYSVNATVYSEYQHV